MGLETRPLTILSKIEGPTEGFIIRSARPAPLPRLHAKMPLPGPVRKVVKTVQDGDTGLAVRLVSVKLDGRTFWEVVVKAKGKTEQTFTFANRANADAVYELGGYGIG